MYVLKRANSYNQEAISIECIVLSFQDRVKKMPEDVEKNEGKKMLKIVSKILYLNLNERNQQGRGLKILTPNMLNR